MVHQTRHDVDNGIMFQSSFGQLWQNKKKHMSCASDLKNYIRVDGDGQPRLRQVISP